MQKGTLVALHVGRMKDAGTLATPQISFAKMDNVRMALEVAREARSVLGANGITTEYPVIRHMNNLESVYTYEGTNEIHTLILGQAITGHRRVQLEAVPRLARRTGPGGSGGSLRSMSRLRTSSLILLCSVATLMAACGGDDAATTTTTAKASTTSDVTAPDDDPDDDPEGDPDDDKVDAAGEDQSDVAAWDRTATDLGGKIGSTAAYDCPSDGDPATVWGTNTYTDDSSIRTAAVQMGLITFDDGGRVTIEVLEGLDEYVGSRANGVTSRDYGSWGGSFSFPDADDLEVSTDIGWSRRANFYNAGDTVTVSCMAAGAPAAVWGTGPFTADSSICTAAVFAGIIDTGGGEVSFEFSEGLDSYPAGEANGVTTREYGSYGSSFDFTN